MKHRVLSIFLTFAIILLIIPNAVIMSALADNVRWKGSGTESKPYLISSREEFEAIADAVNSGNDLLGVYFKQTDDIDFGNEVWPTIGITINNAAHQFRGVFDGGGNKIYNLYVNRHDDDAGLFGYVGEDGVIKNVHVEDGEVRGAYWVGGIAGRNNGIVEYCSFSGYVYGNQQYIGGIVGDNHGGTVSYCCNLGDVEFNLIGGGVVGRNSGGTVENCYNRGYVYSYNIVRGYAGGVVGENTTGSTVENCYSDGWVDGNMACGAIVGANGEGSTVENCFYPEEFEEDGLSGVGSGSGTIENVTPKSKEQFDSGEVAWELSQGKNGGGWGQTLNDDDGNHDEHPHFTDVSDKAYPTTPIYRVSFRANDKSLLPDGFMAFYVDPGEDVPPPQKLPQGAAWYVKDSNGGIAEYDGTNIQCDIDAFAGKRILFKSDDEIVHRLTYSPGEQTVDLDMYLKYAEGGPYSEGRFEYKLTADADGLKAKISDDLKTLIIPAGANAKDSYTLKITAYEKEPFIMPLALIPSEKLSVDMTVKIVIEKATPEITVKPTASDVNYGTALSGSRLSGGTAVHPAARTAVAGSFKWSDPSVVPTVNEAAIKGYYVTFVPSDDANYNSVTLMSTLTVNKVDPTVTQKPKPVNSVFNGMAEFLIDEVIKGSADGGTLKYWISPLDDLSAVPPSDNSEYSSTIPSRASAGTYRIWYKIIGDENHNDLQKNDFYVDAVISPYPLRINEKVFYNGGSNFTLELKGVSVPGESSPRAVIAYVKTYSKNKGSYSYSDVSGAGKFTAELSNSNYVIDKAAANTFVIDPLPVVLRWRGPLTFVYDEKPHTVSAEITNGVGNDTFRLSYSNAAATNAGGYNAEVTGVGNSNYTVDAASGAQNVTQRWHIYKESSNITLTASPDCTDDDRAIIYGDTLTLNAEIVTPISGQDTVYFYVSGEPVGSAKIRQTGGKNIATLVIKDTVSRYNFSLGANAVRADYRIDNNEDNDQVDAITIFVDPRPVTAKITNTEKTYDGNNISTGSKIELGGIEDDDDVKAIADSFTYDSLNAADAHTVTANNVRLSGSNCGNYTIARTLRTTGKIIPKTVKLEWRGVTGLVYTGYPVNVNATATELLPMDLGKCTVTVSDGNKINAGRNYTAMATALSNSNYKLPTDGTAIQKYDIDKADLYVPEQPIPFNDTNKLTAKADGAGPDRKVDIAVTASSPDVGDYTYFGAGASGAGNVTEENTYTASAKSSNYRIVGGAIITITKVDPTYTTPVSNTPIYSGLPQELVTGGTARGGEIQYSLSEDGSGTYYSEIPTGIEIGEYKVWYRIAGDKNHNDIAPRFVNVKILSERDAANVPNDPISGDNTQDDPQTPDKVPNTGVEINYAFFFVLMCLCGSVISAIVRKVR